MFALSLYQRQPFSFNSFESHPFELLEDALGNGENRSVAISALGGMGGIGKSTIAINVAYRVLQNYPDGQIVIDLKGTSPFPLQSHDAMLSVVHSLNPTSKPSADKQVIEREYRSILSQKRVLLIFDDASDAIQVKPLLVPAPTGIIITSRRVIVLPDTLTIRLDKLSRDESIALLRTIIGGNRAKQEELNEIAQLCDYLPLALRAAGTFISVHTDWEIPLYIDALRDKTKRLQRLQQDDINVTASLMLSVEKLIRDDSNLAIFWQELTIFPSSFDLQAVSTIFSIDILSTQDKLSYFVERNLLQFDQNSRRYRFHELMRLASSTILEASVHESRNNYQSRFNTIAKSHASYYLNMLKIAYDLYHEQYSKSTSGIDLFEQEWDNFQSAQQWTATTLDYIVESSKICYELGKIGVGLLQVRKHVDVRITWAEDTVSAAKAMKDTSLEAQAMINLGTALFDSGKIDDAKSTYTQALELSQINLDRKTQGKALSCLGIIYKSLGKPKESIDLQLHALDIFEKIADDNSRALTLTNLGIAYKNLGEFDKAIACYMNQIEIGKKYDDLLILGMAYGNISIAYKHKGNYQDALKYAELQLAASEQTHDYAKKISSLINLADVYKLVENYELSRNLYQDAIALAKDIGWRRLQGVALHNLSLLYEKLQNIKTAILLAEEALIIYDDLKDYEANEIRSKLAEWKML